MKLHVYRVALALAIVTTGLLAPVSSTAVVEARGLAPVLPAAVGEARILGRHTIAGILFRLTPLGRVWATGEDRQDVYRGANDWLVQQQQANSVRLEDLRQARAAKKMDLRSFIHGQATLLRHAEQYVEVTERMKKIGHDNFNRAMGQQIFERFMPRIAQSVGFARRVDSVKGALEAGRQLLEKGALDIDRLAEKAYPQFLRDGRVKVQELMAKLDRAGLSGKPVEDMRRTLAGLERGLGALEKAVPEMVKTDDVKRLQQEARNAAQVLVNTGKALDDGVKRLRDRNTVYFPVRSAERDALVKRAMEEFSTDPSLVRRAIEESKLRRALGPQLEEALVRCGVERSDPLYIKIRQRMLGLVDVSAGAPSESMLDTLCSEARDQITREAEQPGIYGMATLNTELVSLGPLAEHEELSVSWRWRDISAEEDNWYWDNICNACSVWPAMTSLQLSLEVNLETGEVAGSWAGSAAGYVAEGDSQSSCAGDASASLEGAIESGAARMDGDQLGFSFEAEGWTTVNISGALTCKNTPDPKSGSRSDSIQTQISGEWRAGVGSVTIRALSEDRNVFLICVRDVTYEVSAK